MAASVIAIFDIGKTNKKLFLFDEHYQIVLERSAQMPEVTDEDGEACENIALLKTWMQDELAAVLALPEYNIKAINFAAYGASFVHVDKADQIIAPLYNYLKAYPEALKEKFYSDYGGEVVVSATTASPVLGSLNSGMQLYRLKHEKPGLWNRIEWSFHLPQYLSYIVTGQPCSDITSIGCHTNLWNFPKHTYHEWVLRESILEKLPPLYPSDAAMDATVHGVALKAGTGLHDSSSALIPYLASFNEPFVLISTGTWCISLNPFNNAPLTVDELEQDCLCYMEYKGNPVKASRLFAGYEHEQQTKRIAEHFNTENGYYKKVQYDGEIISRLQNTLLKSNGGPVSLKASAFVNRDLAVFSSYEEAYHALIIDIMQQQKASAKLVTDGTGVKRIFVDGGFGKNPIYMNLLAAAFPQLEIFAASVAQATALGAALAIHKQWNAKPVPGDLIELKYFAVSKDIEV